MKPPAKPFDPIESGAQLQKLSTGLKFTEGPTWSNAEGGYLIFSDIPASQLFKWTPRGGHSIYRQPSDNANGNTRDQEDRLITCEHGSRRVTRTGADGEVEILADRFEGKRFNSPNDVVVKSDGSVWFTDPPYGVPKDQQREIDKQGVYRFKDGKVEMVADDFDMPNGLCFSPDEKNLYIADSGKPHHIRVFDVESDELKNGKIFCVIDKGVPDGIRCDERGNVWSSAGDGVQVFLPDGKLVGKILVPEVPANLCFGGSDGKSLFMTARHSLYSIKVSVAGATSRR
jgi:gluconolactonase